MRVFINHNGMVERGEKEGKGVLIIPLTFGFAENEVQHSIDNATIDPFELPGLKEKISTGNITVSPHSESSSKGRREIEFPVRLRHDNENRTNNLDFLVDVVFPAEIDGICHIELSGTMTLNLTFRGVFTIPFKIDFTWDVKQDILRFTFIKRKDSTAIYAWNIALTFGFLVLLYAWNSWGNQSVHNQWSLATPETVTKILIFLCGFLGFPTLSVALEGLRRGSTFISLWEFPELHLPMEAAVFLGKKGSAAFFIVLYIVAAWTIYSLWSIPLPKLDNEILTYIDSSNTEISSSRVYRSDTETGPGIRIVARKALQQPGCNPLPLGSIRPGGRNLTALNDIIPSKALIDYRKYRIVFDHQLRHLIPTKCTEITETPLGIELSFTSDGEFVDKCIDSVRNHLRAHFLGESAPKGTDLTVSRGTEDVFRVSSEKSISLEDLEEFARQKCYPLLSSEMRSHLLKKDLRDLDLAVNEFVAAKKEARVWNEGFMQFYKASIMAFVSTNPENATKSMIILNTVFNLYKKAKSDPLTDDQISDIAKDFKQSYPFDQRGKDRIVDKSKFQSYIRFLLNIESAYFDIPVTDCFREAIESTISGIEKNESLPYYAIYLGEAIRARQLFRERDGEDAIEERRKFLATGLQRFKSLAKCKKIVDDLAKRLQIETGYEKERDYVERMLSGP